TGLAAGRRSRRRTWRRSCRTPGGRQAAAGCWQATADKDRRGHPGSSAGPRPVRALAVCGLIRGDGTRRGPWPVPLDLELRAGRLLAQRNSDPAVLPAAPAAHPVLQSLLRLVALPGPPGVHGVAIRPAP